MRNRHIFMAFTLVAAMVFSPMSADVQQKRKKTQKVVLTEEEKEHIARMAEMEIATQKVVFVDSVVVDKNEMLLGDCKTGGGRQVQRSGVCYRAWRPMHLLRQRCQWSNALMAQRQTRWRLG